MTRRRGQGATLRAETVILDGRPVELVTKNIRHLYVRVLPPDGRIRVSAPPRHTHAEVERFLASRRQWLDDAVAKLSAGQEGDAVRYLWGRPRTVEFFPAPRGTDAELGPGTVRVPLDGHRADREAREHAFRHLLGDQVRAAAEPMFAARASTWGLPLGRTSYRDMTSRWGSCTHATGDIRINIRLGQWPVEFLEYVVTHEMAHLVHANHGPGFRAFMDAALPHWRDLRRVLNTQTPASLWAARGPAGRGD